MKCEVCGRVDVQFSYDEASEITSVKVDGVKFVPERAEWIGVTRLPSVYHVWLGDEEVWVDVPFANALFAFMEKERCSR